MTGKTVSLLLLGVLLLAPGHGHAAPLPVDAALPEPVADGRLHPLQAVNPDMVLRFELSLPLRNAAALDALLADIVDPASPRFRQYLTPAAFAAAYAPDQADYDAVAGWAVRHGLAVSVTVPNRRFMELTGPVRAIDAALHVHMSAFVHPTEHRLFTAPDRAPTPELPVAASAITGLDDFELPTPHVVQGPAELPATATGSGPGGQFTGFDMRAAYYGGTALTGQGQSVGLLELAAYNPGDIRRYFSVLGKPLTTRLKGIGVDTDPFCTGGCNDAEQALDVEEAIAMAPGLDQALIYVGHSPLAVMNQMATDDAAAQLSSSWGWHANRAALAPVLKQYIAQGQTFLCATGDDGYKLAKGVVWPADDQFVTAVGGTNLITAGPGGRWMSEKGWQYSGGGPSPDNIGLPRYQALFVTAANGASATRRNVPDIAAEGAENNWSCYNDGCRGGNGGTSYAAPRWAGFIALANQQAALTGRKPVGFLNYTLYRLGGDAARAKQVFHDQRRGFNGQFGAVPGFDLVTGFGSPKGQAMIDALVGR